MELFLLECVSKGVHGFSVFTQLEVQVRTRGDAAVACGADLLSRHDCVAAGDGTAVQVGIQGNQVITVVDHDIVAPTTVVDGYNDRTAGNCGDGSTDGGVDVNACVEALMAVQSDLAIAEARCDVTVVTYRPEKLGRFCGERCCAAPGQGDCGGILGETAQCQCNQQGTCKEIYSFQAVTAFPKFDLL